MRSAQVLRSIDAASCTVGQVLDVLAIRHPPLMPRRRKRLHDRSTIVGVEIRKQIGPALLNLESLSHAAPFLPAHYSTKLPENVQGSFRDE